MIEASSVAELLAGATDVATIDSAGKSGARLERVRIGGEPYVVKYLDPRTDWTMRAAGVLGSAILELWRRDILARLPTCINQPIVALAREDEMTVLLMRDVGDWLVPVAGGPVPPDQHLRFLDHMAAMHATFWQTSDDIDVVSNRTRYLELSPHTAEREAALGSMHPVPRLIGEGWPLLTEVAPTAAAIVVPLANDPAPLVDALADSPETLVHGNWKLDNLGTDPQGRTVLARLGAARPWACAERPHLVPRDQLPAPAAVEGGHDRRLPRGAGAPRRRHGAVVVATARTLPARRPRSVRVGEGVRRL
ncbi:MAG: hypothetical protein ACR2FE_10920 [Aeromicrobium sp.]